MHKQWSDLGSCIHTVLSIYGTCAMSRWEEPPLCITSAYAQARKGLPLKICTQMSFQETWSICMVLTKLGRIIMNMHSAYLRANRKPGMLTI